ncbi:site-specific integrase [Phenylobacterium sp. LjRoot219]|uniref:tyrosine-type recombinase/integrase n=1 Tax=Phenylobacterium sp. LjRoot219 TaxID=3342283 RepID=UPI003ED04E13
MKDVRRRGRPARYAHFEALHQSLVPGQKKRPTYVHGIGLFRGERGTTAWVKISLRRANTYKGRSYSAGSALEIKLGSLDSWSWEQLEQQHRDLQGRADRGEPLEEAQTVTFAAHAGEWLELKKPVLKSYGIAAGHVAKHLNPTFGAKALTDIAVADVDRWAAKQRKTYKPGAVQRQLTTFKAILNHARKSGLIERSPAADMEPIRGAEARQRFLTEEELKVVLKAARELEEAADGREKYRTNQIKGWLTDFVLWALHSGMRRGEILSLRYGDLRSVPNGGLVAVLQKTKGGSPRVVSCTDEMKAIAERLKEVRREPGDDRLFPVSLTTAKRKLTKLWRSCGLEDVRLHDFRRTHATRLVGAGINMREVAGRLGHRDLSMLEKHYAVFSGDEAASRAAQEAFGSIAKT